MIYQNLQMQKKVLLIAPEFLEDFEGIYFVCST